MSVGVKNNFERRLGIWPAGFDQDDVMWCSTAFGDYPHYLPAEALKQASPRPDWYLLNYKKPLRVSSTLGGYLPNNANNEDIKSYWSAETGDKGEWIESDLGRISTVRAIQINYADQDVAPDRPGKWNGGEQYHQYSLYHSLDGKKWHMLVDKSNNQSDTPPRVEDFMVLRTEKDKRSAWIRWSPVDEAFAYNIYYGTDPGKLYNCIMVLDQNELWLKTLDSQSSYYFTIEAISEKGISESFSISKVL